MLPWLDVPISELRSAVRALGVIIEEEAEAARQANERR
jgi:hypothetical protein